MGMRVFGFNRPTVAKSIVILIIALFALSPLVMETDLKSVVAGGLFGVKSQANAFPDKETVIKLGAVTLEIPAGAVKEPVKIEIERIGKVSRLNPGLENSTTGAGGYRFKPDGMKFLKPVKVTIPYDVASVKDEYDRQNLYTFFYNEEAKYWEQLERVAVNPDMGLVTSLTTHFTDMINGVLKLPESPKPVSFNPNSIKDIKAADPSAKINLISPPEGSGQGSANLQYPIELPPGRNGMQAQVAVQYNSDAENGWLGVGWDLSYPSVSIDTRWGVPRYSREDETETYVLNGAQLTPAAHRGDLQPRTVEKVFQARVEGSFDKIIRHGNSPVNYWWEVTDKKGTRSFYGGLPEKGQIAGAVLYDSTSGNIFKWALVQIRDTNGNTVDYEYSQVQDSGIGNGVSGVPGTQLYVKSIRYTGTVDKPGAYGVYFFRDRDLKEARRPDIMMDARGGFKVVTADLLRRIEVKFNDQMIRSYELKYKEGAFKKTLLESIVQYGRDGKEFNRHTFTYYDEVSAKGVYQGFAAPTAVSTGDDRISMPLLGVATMGATALGGTYTSSTGVHLYVGGSAIPSKDPSIGFKTGSSSSSSEDQVALVDLNGDGLPDKVFKQGGSFYYRPGQRGFQGRLESFGGKISLPTLTGIAAERSFTTTSGPEGYYGGWNVVNNNSTTTTTGTVYFSDVNGDGLPDLVSNGQVYFNHLENGVPTFVLNDSTETPVPISSGSVDNSSLAADLTPIYEQMIDNSPLIDAVRSWTAPLDGQVMINAPVQMLPYDPAANPGADGVRVAVQHNDRELWSASIAAGDFGQHVPAGVGSLAVKKGDRIYFRVQSVFNGVSDQVKWDPEITYLNVPSDLKDVNGHNPYRFKASEDFAYAGREGKIVAPLAGSIRLGGMVRKKGITTDDIRMEVYKGSELVVNRSLTWDSTGEIVLGDEFKVNAQDEIRLKVAVDSPIDLAQIEWMPIAYYTTADDPNVRVFDEKGDPTIVIKVSYDIEFYPVSDVQGAQGYWEATKDGKVLVMPQLTTKSDGAATSTPVAFTVKKAGALLAKKVLAIGGQAPANTAPLTIPVNKGDRLYFDFTARDPHFVESLSSKKVTLIYQDARSTKEQVMVPSAVHCPGIGNLQPAPYRGWSYFGYNGNRERAGQPINENDLTVDEDYGQNEHPKAFLMYPVPEKGYWGSQAELCWIGPGTISSSRVGDASIFLPSASASSGARGVIRLSTSSQSSVGGGWKFASVSSSNGTSEGLVDFMDLNGDRFPDIVSNGKVQYTTMAGGLEEKARPVLPGKVRENSNYAENGGIGGNVPQMVQSAQGFITGSTKGNSKWSMVPLGVQLNLHDQGSSDAVYDLMDMNGDGLPDRVTQSGGNIMVSLNLGYGFAPAENWGSGAISVGKTKNPPLSFSLGWNSGEYAFAGGFSYNSSQSREEKGLNDLNGDGLPDLVVKESDRLYVSFNTGSGFAPAVEWFGALPEKHLSDTANYNAGGGVYFTYPICLLFWNVIINPGADYSVAIGRREAALMDIDGDGLVDHVRSDSDGSIEVALNQTGLTNKLQGVTRPLGGSFALFYQRDGNTYDLPQSKWVLSRVEVNDGHPGDGVDTQVVTFRYSGGKQDRQEREFYGYRTVTAEFRDVANNEAVLRIVVRTFRNDSFYTKGLLEKEEVRDGAGRLFTQTINTYRLWDVAKQTELWGSFANSTVATVFPQLVKTEKYFYEGRTEGAIYTYVTYEYDKYGNVTRYFDAGDGGDEDDVVSSITYAEDLAHYIVDRPASVKVYGGGRLMRRREGSYDAAGNLIELRQYLEDGKAAVSTLAYYPNGNLKEVTGPPNHRGQRYSVNLAYDPVVQTYIIRITDSFGYTSTAEYDYLYGQETRSVDINGGILRREYDAFGRPTRIFGPYDEEIPAVEFEYYPEEAPARAVTHNKVAFDPDDEETLDTVVFIDGLTRVIQTKKEGEVQETGSSSVAYGMNVTGTVRFDALNRVFQQGQPVFQEGYDTGFYADVPLKNPTVNEYDLLDRKTRVILPDGSEIKTEYTTEHGRFKTTVTDPEGQVKQSYQDVSGLTVETVQYNQGRAITTTYEYSPLNEIVQITDDQGNVTRMAYDFLGQRTSIDSPDRGLVESYYDLAGNLVKKVDGNLRKKGQAIAYTYEYSRLQKIDYPASPDVTYLYGEPGAENNRAGRIMKITDASGSTEFFYGEMGEEVKQVRRINTRVPYPQTAAFTTETGYDYLGRVTWLLYPDGERLTYVYDQGGQITAAYGEKQGDRYDYVKEIRYDEFGQRAYIKYGNGVETNYTYDPYRRWLAQINTEGSFGDTFQDLRYSFDRVGNVLGIENKARGVSQSFQYDDLYQLTRAEGKAAFKANAESRYTQTFTYDSIGNMLRKTSSNRVTPGNNTPKDLNYDFAYKYNGTRPHAPTQIGAWTYKYDENGNLLRKDRLTGTESSGNVNDGDSQGGIYRLYTWDEENRLIQADVNGQSNYFVYDASGDRAVKRGPGGETIYVSEYMQVQNQNTGTKHVFIGDTRVASKLFHAGNGSYNQNYEERNVYYYHSDHLGSSNFVTDFEAREFEHFEYTPYGETWVEKGNGKDVIGYRFTSKELDTETGLYYFGARYYDPLTSRWASPDPAGEKLIDKWSIKREDENSPLNKLNWFLYCNNNPLKYSDPDGRQPEKAHAGTIQDFTQVMNNSPSRIGMTTGGGAAKALVYLGSTKGIKPAATPYFNMAKGRYVYTEKTGWIDMVHFLFYAGRAYTHLSQGDKNPIGEALQEGYRQEAFDKIQAPWSAYSYEDLPSDKYGAIFGAQIFNPNSSSTLAEQIENYLTNLGATNPEKAPNWDDLPNSDSKNPPMKRNYSTDPMFVKGEGK